MYGLMANARSGVILPRLIAGTEIPSNGAGGLETVRAVDEHVFDVAWRPLDADENRPHESCVPPPQSPTRVLGIDGHSVKGRTYRPR